MNIFKIVALAFFLFFIYAALKKEKKGTRFLIIIYFILISIVFMFGIFYISDKYHLYDGPVLDRGFESLMKWVSGFSYLYIIPTLMIVAYKLFRLTQNLLCRTWVKVTINILCLIGLIAIGFIAFFVFILVFYGFAP